jgi:copper chaperone CopZ
MEPDRIEVQGMSCGHCVARVRAAVEKVPGVDVRSVEIGEVRFLRDPAKADREKIVAAIQSAGYSAR